MSNDSTTRNYSFVCPCCACQITIAAPRGHGALSASIEFRLDPDLNNQTQPLKGTESIHEALRKAASV